MAKKIQRKKARTQKKSVESPFKVYWTKQNYIFLFAGFIILIAGFYFMTIRPWDSEASLVISPILLFIAYILIFPASIFYRKKQALNEPKEKEIASGKS